MFRKHQILIISNLMNKKKTLFVIHRLDAGGAEKSLVSLLNSLPFDRFEIDLLSVDPTGIFRNQVPSKVKLLDVPRELICQNAQIMHKRFWKNVTFRTLCIKLQCIIGNRFRGKVSKNKLCHSQYYNKIWKRHIPDCPNAYDVAVSYIDGMNYYVIDHVNADKKILWCHNDYNKLNFVPEYDLPYYEMADNICTISEQCKASLIENFPTQKSKIKVVENISSARLINAQAKMYDEMQFSGDGFIHDKRFKLVSIGRLSEQKGFDYAVDAAKILKEKGVDFCWYILGEGPLRHVLENQAKKKCVTDVIKFIGVRSNPYPYIKNADLYVMPSRYEGKSIALDEAKILCKPIVVTNYPSVHDAIENGKDGLVVDTTANAIAEGIIIMYNDEYLRYSFVQRLSKESCGNEQKVITKFLELVDINK